jgi:hypothetical protein
MSRNIKLLKNLFLKNQYGGNSNKSNDTNTILLIILVAIVIFFIYIYFNNKMNINISVNTNPEEKYNNSYNNTNNTNNKNNTNTDSDSKVIINDYHTTHPRVVNTLPILREYDYRTYNDPLTPPYKRDDYMIPAHIVDPINFGMYTRGVPPVFKKMGYLIDDNASDDKYKFLNLMGRQKYYNSNEYEYYIVSTDRNENIKFDLGKKYRKELYSGDKVKVQQLNDKEYTVNIDKNLDYEYNPFII